jgi:hypothetical protein
MLRTIRFLERGDGTSSNGSDDKFYSHRCIPNLIKHGTLLLNVGSGPAIPLDNPQVDLGNCIWDLTRTESVDDIRDRYRVVGTNRQYVYILTKIRRE